MVKAPKAHRGEVYLVDLDPTRGSEIKRARPCLVVSPDELNDNSRTLIVAPLTTGSHSYPFRVLCEFQDKRGHIVLDQIRAVDKERLVRRLGVLSPRELEKSLVILQEMFSL